MTYKEALAKVMDAAKRDEGINTSDGVRDLANAMFIACRQAGEMSEEELIFNLARLTGMACAALLEYADRLEEDGQ